MSTMPPREIALIKSSVRWRRLLEKSFHRRNKTGARKLALCIVEGLVFLKLAQQRKLEPGKLLSRLRAEDSIPALQDCFDRAKLKYHSTLFVLPHLHVSSRLTSALTKIVRALRALRVATLSPSLLGKIYETDLSGHRSGVFFTPDFISEYLVRSTLKPLIGKTKFPAILDPACGAGAFPLQMFEQLLKTRGAKVSFKEKQRVLLRCIHGVDIDAFGVELTKLSLLLKLFEGSAPAPVPDLSLNIHCGNALLASGFPELNPLNFARAFPGIARAGGFDAVIVNPPYINITQLTKQHGPSIRNYLERYFRTARGNFDLFVRFMEQSLKRLRAGGRLRIIVPNKFALKSFAQRCRQMLLNQTRVESIADITPMCNRSPEGVYPYILICEKTPAPAQHKIRIIDVHSRADLKPNSSFQSVPQNSLKSESGFDIHA